MEQDITHSTDVLEFYAGLREHSTNDAPLEEEATSEPEWGITDTTSEEEEEKPIGLPQEKKGKEKNCDVLWEEAEDEEEPSAAPQDEDEEETTATCSHGVIAPQEDKTTAALTKQEATDGPRMENIFASAEYDFKVTGVTRTSMTPASLATPFTQTFKNFPSKDHYFQQQIEQRKRDLDFKLQQRRASNMRQMIMEQVASNQAQKELERQKKLSELSLLDKVPPATKSSEDVQTSGGQSGEHNHATDKELASHKVTEEEKHSEVERHQRTKDNKDNESCTSNPQTRHKAENKEKTKKQSKGGWFKNCCKKNTKNKSSSL
ncbi:FK506-binding protein 3-like [Hippocampus comes]|uniref:FK506-binding protein 3-like n=1 Tax=Hippocampus comes TaxID=109280 RepID=UPI00094E9393|nr:PREDICTED: FK506-binding protein 3-like [Hippocampus comes]